MSTLGSIGTAAQCNLVAPSVGKNDQTKIVSRKNTDRRRGSFALSIKHALSLYAWKYFGISATRSGFEFLAQERNILHRAIREFEVDCIFDVGANVGQFCKLLREAGFHGPIISFEPIPALAQRLPAPRPKSKQGNWFVEEAALDSQVRGVDFNVMATTEFSSLLHPSRAETVAASNANTIEHTIRLTTRTLDTEFDRYQSKLGFKRPFLKLDTQGKRSRCRSGAGDRLGQFTAVLTELAIKRLYDRQPDFRTVTDFYFSRGFEVASILPNHPHFPEMLEVDFLFRNVALTNGR